MLAPLLLAILPCEAPQALLTGRVIDAAGAPVARASVLFQQDAQPFGDRVILRAGTGEDGRFELFGIAPLGVAGTVSAQRTFLGSPEPVAAVLGGPDVEVVIREGASVEGRLAGTGPFPANLALELRSTRTGLTRVVDLDARGGLRASGLLPGEHEVRVVVGAEPLLSLGRLVLEDGEEAKPRALDPLALPPLALLEVHVRTRDGRATAPQLEWRPAGAPDDAWRKLRGAASGHATTLAALAPALDVRAWAPGLRPAEARAARGSVALELAPGLSVALHLTRALDFDGAETCMLALVPEADPRARGTSVPVARGQRAFASTVSVAGRHAVRLWHDPSRANRISPSESPFDPPTTPPSSFEELVLGYVLVRDAEGEQTLVLEPEGDVLARAAAALAGG